MTGYYRRFIKDYAAISRPLQLLTRKQAKLQWSPECQITFAALKTLLINPPISHYPDFSKPFILYTDASGAAIGCTVSLKDDTGADCAICYAGRALEVGEQQYHISEQELLAIFYGQSYFKHYMCSSKVTVVTDCSVLQHLKTAPLRGRIARWALV